MQLESVRHLAAELALLRLLVYALQCDVRYIPHYMSRYTCTQQYMTTFCTQKRYTTFSLYRQYLTETHVCVGVSCM